MPPVVLGGAATLISLATVAWAIQPGDDATSTGPELARVHGLGIDPAAGALYAATRDGVFRLPDGGGAMRVGGVRDTTGFTVAGPKRFLASGRPAVGDDELRVEGKPPLLGLIESTDAGENWRPLSLLGETNFAALAAAHDRVYGFSATDETFMVSRGGRRWDTRSRIALLSFAVDPEDPDHILGAAAGGVVESVDGGRTWDPIDAPELVLLSWHAEGGLWGADEDGKIHRSGDGGSSWERAGKLPGEPEALLADADALYAAVRDKGIVRSIDEGRTWKLRHGGH